VTRARKVLRTHRRNVRFAMSFLLAPVGLAARWGCVFALFNWHLGDFPYIFLAVIEEDLPRALLLGVPTALVLRSRGLLTFHTAVGSAALIGAIPIGTVYRSRPSSLAIGR